MTVEAPLKSRLRWENIETAAGVIDTIFLNTPQYVSPGLSKQFGCDVIVKVETVNPIRCFKGRGADYFVSKLAVGSNLVTASAGNLGQAAAYACARRGLRLTVFAAQTANRYKIQKMQDLGAEVILTGNDFDAAKSAAKEYAHARGVRFLEDSADIETVEGAGTIALELARFGRSIDAIIASLGNGALVCGIGCYQKHARPATNVVAVQAEGAPAMARSWEARRVITTERASTIADGIAVRVPIAQCVHDMCEVVDAALTVSDHSIAEGMKVAHRELGLVLEPAGAAPVAALIDHGDRFRGKCVAIVLCGGNVNPEQARSFLSEAQITNVNRP